MTYGEKVTKTDEPLLAGTNTKPQEVKRHMEDEWSRFFFDLRHGMYICVDDKHLFFYLFKQSH